MASRSAPTPPPGLALIRIATGLVLLRHGWRWVSEGGFDGNVVLDSVEASRERLAALCAWWGDAFLLINPDAFAFFWRWGALLFGLALALGALTRPAGLLASLFLFHGYVYGPEPHRLAFLVLAVAALGCGMSCAGRRLGLDAWLDKDCPSWLTWTSDRRSTGLFP